MVRRETTDAPERLTAALAGLRRYQQAARPTPPPPAPILARAGRAVLRDYGGPADAPTVVFVPSLINPPSVLDLTPDRSLLRWLATQGLRPMLVDWGGPTPADANQNIAAHVEQMLLPLLDAAQALDSRNTPPALVGYCLGGTMAIAAAAARPVAALALLAAPWSFAGFPDDSRAGLAKLWTDAAPATRQLGLLPMELLQAVFWQLDPARTVARFVDFATRPDIAAHVGLEDWANDGPPIALAAGQELFEGLFRDDLPGRGLWTVAGGPVDPAAIACPILDIVSTSDRIVPAASALSNRLPHAARLSLDLGHVGMVVGRQGPERLWKPLRDWLLHPAAG
ncbi:alpha/beta hydrolase [Sphingomonas prati]|nr:alpha/beta hydrolase [Sphingomonas prati]